MRRISDLERTYVLEVLESQFRSSAGNRMSGRLEQAFADTFNCRYAIAFVNGTATLHAALVAAGVGPGDEVIVPPLTMASTSLAVVHANAMPVFADVDPHTWTLDPKSIRERISERTKAVIPVSIFGLSPEMDAIMDLAARYNLFVLEDDAQCYLGRYRDRIVGSIGDAASFSFQSSKHMTSGEGGMVTTNDEDLANKIRRFNSLGYAAVSAAPGKGKIGKDVIQDPAYERHVSIGWNYRMSELCAAVALAQLERLRELVEARVKVAQLYADASEGCRWLVPQAVPDTCEHSYWTYPVRLENGNAFTWHDFRRKYMELGGDGVYAAWQLTYLEPAFRHGTFARWVRPGDPNGGQVYDYGLCPVAESIQPKLLQFKTNYVEADVAIQKADALAATISYFGR